MPAAWSAASPRNCALMSEVRSPASIAEIVAELNELTCAEFKPLMLVDEKAASNTVLRLAICAVVYPVTALAGTAENCAPEKRTNCAVLKPAIWRLVSPTRSADSSAVTLVVPIASNWAVVNPRMFATVKASSFSTAKVAI